MDEVIAMMELAPLPQPWGFYHSDRSQLRNWLLGDAGRWQEAAVTYARMGDRFSAAVCTARADESLRAWRKKLSEHAELARQEMERVNGRLR